jgi:hypothetical protein
MTSAELAERLGRYRTQIETSAFGLALLAIGLWAGVAAHRSAGALAIEASRLQAQVARLERWRVQFRQATAGETSDWQRIDAALARLGVQPQERVTIAQVVARAGEDAGLADVRVRFVSPDSIGEQLAGRAARVGTHGFRPATFGLALSGSGSYDALVRFIGTLPPSVMVRQLSSSRANTTVVHAVVLSVFESVENNESGPTAVPMGSDDAARGLRRSGGVAPSE